ARALPHRRLRRSARGGDSGSGRRAIGFRGAGESVFQPGAHRRAHRATQRGLSGGGHAAHTWPNLPAGGRQRGGGTVARNALRRANYDAAKNTIPLDLDVTEGPRVQVSLKGAKFSKSELKKLIPIYQEGAVDADLLEEGKRNVRERLERQGYFDADVNYTTETHEMKSDHGAARGTEEVITY